MTPMWRLLCVKPDGYPIPFLLNILAPLCTKTIFNKRHLVRAYNQIPVHHGYHIIWAF